MVNRGRVVVMVIRVVRLFATSVADGSYMGPSVTVLLVVCPLIRTLFLQESLTSDNGSKTICHKPELPCTVLLSLTVSENT